MSRSKAVLDWRRRTKTRIISAMGGHCALCGYSRCPDALELHHLDPDTKDFGLSGVRANPKSWANIVAELRKCVLLCSNCHREVHAGTSSVPDDAPRFNEAFVTYPAREPSLCPVCNEVIPNQQKTCSPACSAKKRQKLNWDDIDLASMSLTMTNGEIASRLGVSDVTVSRRLRSRSRR